MNEAGAVQVIDTMLQRLLLNFEACSAPMDVVDTIHLAISYKPRITDFGVVAVTDGFVGVYEDMLHNLALFIVSDKLQARALLLHDVLTTMRYRLKPAFVVLYPKYNNTF
jgi:hypothetical protein